MTVLKSPISTRLLYTRKQVAELLGGVDVATVRRLERAKKLTPFRLPGSAVGQVFFRAQEVHALVKEAADASAT